MTRLLTLLVYLAAFLMGWKWGYADAQLHALRGLFPRISRRDARAVWRDMEAHR